MKCIASLINGRYWILKLAIILGMLAVGSNHAGVAQNIPAPIPTTINAPIPTISSAEPVEMTTHESLSLATGGVAFSLPVISLPQRGGTSLNIGFVLSGNNYTLRETQNQFQANNGFENDLAPQFLTIQEKQSLSAPWYSIIHPNLPTLTADLSYAGMISHDAVAVTDPPFWINNPEYCMQNWNFTDWDGSSHSFNGTRDCSNGSWVFDELTPLNSVTISSTDDSFYILDATNSSDIHVTKRDGTVYHFGGYSANYVQSQCANCEAMQDLTFLDRYAAIASSIVDPNGNAITIANNVITDTLGRKITASSTSISYEAMNGTSTTPVIATVSSSNTGAFTPWPIQYPASGTNGYEGPCRVTSANVAPSNYGGNPPPQLIYEGPGVGGSGGYSSTYTITLPNQGTYKLDFDVTGDLIEVVYPSGGYTKYDYQYGRMSQPQNFGDVTCAIPSIELLAKHECTLASGSCTPAPTSTTIGSCVAGQPLGGEATTCYSGLYGVLPGPYASGTSVTVIDPAGNTSFHASGGNTTYTNGSGANGTSNSFYIGYYDALEVDYVGSSTPLKQVLKIYGTDTNCALSGSVWSLNPCSITTTYYNGGSSISSVVQMQYDAVQPFNVTQIQDFDYSGSLIKTQNAVWEHGGIYAAGAAGTTTLSNVLDHLQSATVTDPVTGNSNTKTYSYDGLGNLESIAVSGTNVLTATTSYLPLDAYGRPTQMTDPKGNVTKYSYNTDSSWSDATCAPPGGTQAYLTSVINAKNQTTSYQYDSCTGDLGSMTDPNGQTTSFSYDVLGRTTQISYPDGGWVQNSYVDTPPLSIQTTKNQAPDPNVVANVVLDGFARKSQTQLLSDPAGTVYTDTTYDALGRVASVSNPYRSGGPVATNGITQYGYDALSRKTLQIQPDMSILQWCYNGMADPQHPQNNCRANLSSFTAGTWVDNSDEVGNNWQHVSDAAGRLRSVVEPYSYETDYAYSGFGDLLQVDQWGGAAGSTGDHRRVFAYDALSRLLTSQNPETGTICYGQWSGGSPGAGSCQYGYDANGNLLYKTDARGVVTGFNYDSLNRLTGKSYSGLTSAASAIAVNTPPVAYIYDSVNGVPVPNAIGRLVAESTGPPGTPITQRQIVGSGYDPMGRIWQETQTTTPPGYSGISATFQYFYDLAGNVTYSTNGSSNTGIGLSYSYDGADRLKSLTSTWDDATHPAQLFAPPSSGAQYGPVGLIAASLGVSTSTQQPLFNQQRTYDNRMRVLSESDFSTQQSGTPTPSAGSITVSGNEQQYNLPATPGTGIITLEGGDGSSGLTICPQHRACVSQPDSGTFTVTLTSPDGSTTFSAVVDFDGEDDVTLANELIAALAVPDASGNNPIVSGSINPVTVVGFAEIDLTALTTGAATNYLMNVSVVGNTDQNDYPYFTSGVLTGGVDGGLTPDAGTIYVSVNGVQAMVPWQSGSDAQTLSSLIYQQIQPAPFLIVTPVGATIDLASTQPGSATDWPISCSATDAYGQPVSFSVSCPGMTGGSNGGSPVDYQYTIPPSGGYAGNGNLLSVTDSVMGTWNYGYDNLNRLLTAQASANAQTGYAPYGTGLLSWGYDSFGNYLGQTLTGNTSAVVSQGSYTPTPNNQMVGYSYDAAGNLLSDRVNTYTYDAENRVATVDGAIQYIYNANGNRVAKLSSGALTNRYLLGLGGEQVSELDGQGNWLHSYVYSTGKELAKYDGSGLHFNFTDWLGTRRAQGSGATGQLEETCLSLTFGDSLQCTGSTGQANSDQNGLHFTGKERDTESGLDYFGARYYGSAMGRFISPDPKLASAHPGDPQTWNRYAYVDNNPMKFIDPDGMEKYLTIYVQQPLPNTRTVEGEGSFGHAFIGYRDTDVSRADTKVGFYPKSKIDLLYEATVKGELRDDAASEWNVKYTYKLSDEGYDKLVADIAYQEGHPEMYNMKDNNCATWVIDEAAKVGMYLPRTEGAFGGDKSVNPGDLGQDMMGHGGELAPGQNSRSQSGNSSGSSSSGFHFDFGRDYNILYNSDTNRGTYVYR